MTSRKRRLAAAALPICAIVLLAGAWFASAGDLNAPAGAIGPTMKTLVEVEPRIAINATNTPGDADSLYRIAQPGSYYLTGNITGVGGKHGIEVAAGGVSVDLMGFEMAGVPGALVGITVPFGGGDYLAVDGGLVRDWPLGGLDASLSAGAAIENVTARSNGGPGVAAGAGCTMERCRAIQNVGAGLSAGDGSTIHFCSASATTGTGIIAGAGCVVSNCAAASNTDHGMLLGNGCSVTDSTARGNSDNGIVAATGCTIQRCTAMENVLDGIEVNSGCMVLSNNCRGNGAGGGSGAGIHVTGSGNRIEANNAGANDRGIEFGFAGNNVAGTDNIVVRNTVTGGPGGVPGNYVFHPLGVQSAYGEILNFTAGGELRATNSHAWANFEF